MIDENSLNVKIKSFTVDGNDFTLFQKKGSPISIHITWPLGSSIDPKGKKGLAHFFEHALLDGSKKFPEKVDGFELLERMGGWLNAYTDNDRLSFITKFGDKDDLAEVVEYMADVVENPLFKQETIDSERKTVIQELLNEKIQNSQHLNSLIGKALFKNTPLEAPILGFEKDLKAITRQDMLKTHKMFLKIKPQIFIAGDVEEKTAKEVFKGKFSFLGNADYEPEKLNLKEKPENNVFKKNDKQLSCIMGYRSIGMNSKDLLTLKILSNYLGSGGSSILFREVRIKRGLVYSIYAYNRTYADNGSFEIRFDTNKSTVEKVFEVVSSELNKVKKVGISQKDLSKEKSTMMKYSRVQFERVGNLAEFHSKLFAYPDRYYKDVFDYFEKLEKVTPKDIKRVANKYFVPENFAYALIGDFDKKLSYSSET